MNPAREWPVALRRLARTDPCRQAAAARHSAARVTGQLSNRSAWTPAVSILGKSGDEEWMAHGFLHSARFVPLDGQEPCKQGAPECQDSVTTRQDNVQRLSGDVLATTQLSSMSVCISGA